MQTRVDAVLSAILFWLLALYVNPAITSGKEYRRFSLTLCHLALSWSGYKINCATVYTQL
jgi:hypothetical protein